MHPQSLSKAPILNHQDPKGKGDTEEPQIAENN